VPSAGKAKKLPGREPSSAQNADLFAQPVEKGERISARNVKNIH